MNALCVGTVVYDQNPHFVRQYIEALTGQTDADFDVVLCNDGYGKYADLKSSLASKSIIDALPRDTRFGHRLSLIDTAKERGYETLVFCDFDDLMPPNYIREMRRHTGSDFTVSDLTAIDEAGAVVAASVWADRLNRWQRIEAGHLQDHNMVGFGNTAVNLRRPWITHFDVDLRRVDIPDWFFFSVNTLKNRFTGAINTAEPMRYRSHAQNFVGLNTIDGETRARMKRNHYKVLHLELNQPEEVPASKSRVKNRPDPSDFWWE